MKTKLRWINLLIACFLFVGLAGIPQPQVSASPPVPETPQDVEAMPGPIITFDGIARTDPDNVIDTETLIPDTTGAAGHTHFMQAVNKAIAIYRKDGTLIDASSFGAFWDYANTTTLCDIPANHHGQPYLMYDHLSGRWVVADVAYANVDDGPYYICLAVSTSIQAPLTPAPYFVDNPLDPFTHYWYFYAIPTNSGPPHYYPVMPKLGLWPDGYYMSVDLFDVWNNGLNRTPKGVKVWALNREDLISGGIGGVRMKSFYLNEHKGFEHLVPSNLLGLAPIDPRPNYFAAIQPGKFHIWKFNANWVDLDASTFGTSNQSPNISFNTDTSSIWANGFIIQQPYVLVNDYELLEAHGDRLMSPLQFRVVDGNASLWATHTVMSGVLTGIRWYELQFGSAPDYTPYFYQQGTYQPDEHFRWLGSLAVDRVGNMAVGYSASSRTLYPSIRYAGRLKSDPLGWLAQGESTLFAGTAAQVDGDNIPDGPWGRQSQMSVDPLDECVFWYTNMYYNTNGLNWRTRIGWFSFPECRGGAITRVSLHTNNTQGNDASGIDFEMYSVAISANGRWVAFSSDASTLVNNDTNNRRDVFVRDRDTDADGLYDEPGSVQTVRITGIGIDGLQSNGDSLEVSMSYDGRYVVFSSDASNLVSGDGNGARDIFLYDRSTGTMRRISVVNGTVNGSANGPSDHPFISGDGRYVAFRSRANNLVTGDTFPYEDIFIRDRSTNQTVRVSMGAGAVQANGNSFTPTLSEDGLYVAFASDATNLVPGDTNASTDVFVVYWPTGAIIRVSVQDSTGVEGDDDSYTPYISGNASFVVFASRATNLLGPGVDTNGYADIFIYDLNSVIPIVDLVSVNFFGVQAANGDSYSPSVTPDGRFIAFASDATNLDVFLWDLNARRDIYLHDRSLAVDGVYDVGLTQRISLDTLRGEPNDWSFAPVIAAEGRHIAFVSEASDLVVNDTNSAWDVFAYDSQRFTPTFLRIPSNVPGSPGDVVSMPVYFSRNGYSIDTTIFSIDYDHLCLNFDPTIPNAVQFSVPAGFTAFYSFDPTDITGELDFWVYDQIEPRGSLPDGVLVTVKFVVKATCQPAPGYTNSARVGFSANPPPSFGSYGISIRGFAVDGFVRIQNGRPGDCNGDGYVNAADLSGLVLEIFDGDGTLPINTPGGTFPGNPVGCNPNQDSVVDAADISCTVMIIWGGGSAGCADGFLSMRTSGKEGSLSEDMSSQPVNLVIPQGLLADPGSQVIVPVYFQPQGNSISSMVFSVDFNENWLSLDTSDGNGDGIPDAIWFNLPQGVVKGVSFNPSDTDGELDFIIYSFPTPIELPAGLILTVKFNTGSPQGAFLAQVRSSTEPSASFGSMDGRSVLGYLQDGSVWINLIISRLYLPVLHK